MTAQKEYSQMEQRKEQRVSKQLYVQISAEKKVFWGLLNDFSTNGLFIKCNQDFPMGAAIEIEIFMSDKSNSVLKGIVRRMIDMPESNRKYGLGIELIEKDARYIRFVKSVSEKPDMETVNIAN